MLLPNLVAETGYSTATRWQLHDGPSTVWKVDASLLPHQDFIEQGGRRVGQKVAYLVKVDRSVDVQRDVIWPSLRINPNNTHGSLVQHYGLEATPVIKVDGKPMPPFLATEVRLDGTLTIIGKAGTLGIKRIFFPSMDNYSAWDRWTVTNEGTSPVSLNLSLPDLTSEKIGPYGTNVMEVKLDGPSITQLAPSASLTFGVACCARLKETAVTNLNGDQDKKNRRKFIETLNHSLQLETPDPVLNTAFTFAKWRVAEAINDTKGGMMLAPGNLRYYAATWCNDNVEYAGPFFPFLGDEGGNGGSLNAYRQYIPFMKEKYERIPCSVIAEGKGIWGPFDRGDAAMYCYGASRFCLALGDRTVAQELWKGIEWTLEYCRRKLNADGVVESDTDELEHRIPSGKANLTTSCLYYGGLRSGADLARELGKSDLAINYDKQADVLRAAIDKYFGAEVEGFPTYRYYDPASLPQNPNDKKPYPPAPVLRSWICVPLCMGIVDRKEGTLDALFSDQMWKPDGLASISGSGTFWDRSTLYALRGVFQAGETDCGLIYLKQYTLRRLLSEHVPYPVEAYPEGGQGHLASESGLYCRIYVEGMFGVLPTGLNRFRWTPQLPKEWPFMRLRHVKAFGRDFDLCVTRVDNKLQLDVLLDGKPFQSEMVVPGKSMEVVLP
jgi:hypothetical protein